MHNPSPALPQVGNGSHGLERDQRALFYPMSSDRYLTVAEKRAVLAEWDALKLECAPEGDTGGKGYVDPDMVYWCDQLNMIPGVAIVQSCAGHIESGTYRSSGHLWLRLAPDVGIAFDRAAFCLAGRTEYIEEVTRIYSAWGQEIACVRFKGNEHDLLTDSMEVVLAFFRNLCD